ncbi:hypothetical protein [Neisseria sp.]
MKQYLIALTALMTCTTAFAGYNKFTPSTYETPNGKKTKVMAISNNEDMRLVVACNNKTIGDNSVKGKVLLVGQDHDVVTQVIPLSNNRLKAVTQLGWESVFKAKSLPKC